MKITKLCLDLDDVCNEFTLHALKHIGCPIDTQDWSVYNPEWGFNIIEAANAFGYLCNKESFWSQFRCKDWANLPRSRELPNLLVLADNLVGLENTLILTAPISGPEISTLVTMDCLTGKYRWIIENLPIDMHRQFSMTPVKHFCATPSTLLIDDSNENVDTFRANGGQAILMPRPWNREHANTQTAWNYIKEEIAQLYLWNGTHEEKD